MTPAAGLTFGGGGGKPACANALSKAKEVLKSVPVTNVSAKIVCFMLSSLRGLCGRLPFLLAV